MTEGQTVKGHIHEPLQLPLRTINIEGLPKLIAGNGPVTAVNVVLERRRRLKGATLSSLDAYARAARLYAEFCAHLRRSIIDISNQDFHRFKDALLGFTFPDAEKRRVTLTGKRPRGERTADLMLALIYSIAKDVEELYEVRFDWRRYDTPDSSFVAVCAGRGGRWGVSFPRAHRVRWTPRKVIGLPDGQFIRLIHAAREKWGDQIADGDLAFAADPELQRGALFYRNAAILFVLRYAGSRRGEVTFINFDDVRRTESKLLLVTKGHGGESGERLPVLLFPFVDELLWRYATRYRPETDDASPESRRVFLSHSVRNYGRPISAQTVRKLVDVLRPALDCPWNEILTPHMLRHSFAYQVQMLGGTAAVTASMRHASSRSSEPYDAGVDVFADDLLDSVGHEVKEVLIRSGLHDVLTTR